LGLGKIFVFSTLSGLSFAFSYNAGKESQTSFVFAVLDLLNREGDPSINALVTVVSIVATIFSIYGLSVFFRQIYENRLAGIITAIVGFASTFVIITGTVQNPMYIFLGIVLLIAGLVTTMLLVRKR
jgi:hypothetical protein